MKNLFIIATMLSCTIAFGQKQKSGKVRHATSTERLPPTTAPGSTEVSESENCFLFRKEESKDSLVHITENLLEYSKSDNTARLIISKSESDPIKEAEIKKQGMILLRIPEDQIIDGTFHIIKGILTFQPLDEKFEKRTFKLVYKPGTKTLNYLRDQQNNIYNRGKCREKHVRM